MSPRGWSGETSNGMAAALASARGLGGCVRDVGRARHCLHNGAERSRNVYQFVLSRPAHGEECRWRARETAWSAAFLSDSTTPEGTKPVQPTRPERAWLATGLRCRLRRTLRHSLGARGARALLWAPRRRGVDNTGEPRTGYGHLGPAPVAVWPFSRWVRAEFALWPRAPGPVVR
jgi:hypothetical protein